MVVVEEASKSSLRKYALSLRKEINSKLDKENIIREKILNHEKVRKSSNILIYVSKKDEVDTIEIIKSLWNSNKNVYVPKVEGEIINFYQINSLKDLKLGKFQVLEPITNIKYKNNLNGCIIVPGLLFDKDNNRLGYGKGYYDKFLSKNNIYKIGICFSTFIVDKINTNKFDIKMDEVITER